MPKPVMLIDKREMQKRRGSRRKALPIQVPKGWEYDVVTLETGDYTVAGLRHHVCVERKAIPDLFKTLTTKSSKQRFMRELSRSRDFKKFYLWIQGTFADVLAYNGKFRGRSNNLGLVKYMYELSAEFGFEIAFADEDPVIAGKHMAALLLTYHKLMLSGKIRVRRGVKYNV